MSSPGARSTPHEPHFSTKGHIVFDAEVDSIGCCAATCLTLACCSSHDVERSYLILREDELEANFATKHPCCCCAFDSLTVRRYDRLFNYEENWPLTVSLSL